MENKLVAKIRGAEARGSGVSRRLRREGWLPGVINNKKCESWLIQMNRHDFEMVLRHHSSENMILDMEVDGQKPRKVLLNEVQRDPLTDNILHVDFLEISMTEKMRTHIRIALTGEAQGVIQEGGVLGHRLREIEVECMPADLVEQIEVDVSALKIGDSIRIEDITVDPKITVLTAGDVAVASVSAPRKEEEIVPEETKEAAEGAEPEVIGEKEKEKSGAEKGEQKAGASAKAEASKEDKGQKGQKKRE